MYEELEVITATGAALHALQVLNGEVEPYIKVSQEETRLKNLQSNNSNSNS